MEQTKIGVIGCGVISGIYLKNCQLFENLEIVACADLIKERAEKRASEFGIPQACSVDEVLANEEIRLVINLTLPQTHTSVDLQILSANKNVYSEKPLALNKKDAKRVLDLAAEKRLRVGCAPDTFLGAGIQTCRKILDEGWIGEPVSAAAFMMNHGHESWHPDPEFYYKSGGGPLFDMGPYYLTALINLLGPVKRVSGMTKISFPQRTITSEAKYGSAIDVEVPTFTAGTLGFENGVIGTLTTTFDVWAHKMPFIEIYGSAGTLRVPDPNTFGGTPSIKRAGHDDWAEVPLLYSFVENSRGVGISDMADAIQGDKPFRAWGELAFHVLDIMESIHLSAQTGHHLELDSHCQKPAPMPLNQSFQEKTWKI
ncbi:MAG: Gfo/Idh/MocA family oxidoreductase [SAR324 cluster bacterium]|nr:Gfo/Idh/MocA family oxidoreductase [SAR324 cluster bacterium]